ncbi:MAG: hypothetical protein U5M23_13040 [Marinagarivorans sp.]|nr:hypothetical protein [Marinagarivorans sp.]
MPAIKALLAIAIMALIAITAWFIFGKNRLQSKNDALKIVILQSAAINPINVDRVVQQSAVNASQELLAIRLFIVNPSENYPAGTTEHYLIIDTIEPEKHLKLFKIPIDFDTNNSNQAYTNSRELYQILTAKKISTTKTPLILHTR